MSEPQKIKELKHPEELSWNHESKSVDSPPWNQAADVSLMQYPESPIHIKEYGLNYRASYYNDLSSIP